MKLSVIFGVLHMTMGIVTKGTNCVYFRDWASLVTEVIAGLIILLGLFGWMDLLIIAKWFCPVDIDSPVKHVGEKIMIKTDSDLPEENLIDQKEGDYRNNHMPSVINLMIDTVFNMGTSKAKDPIAYIGGDIKTQMGIGFTFLVIAVIMIPIMLLVKPCFFRGEEPAEDHEEIEFTNIQNQEGNGNNQQI